MMKKAMARAIFEGNHDVIAVYIRSRRRRVVEDNIQMLELEMFRKEQMNSVPSVRRLEGVFCREQYAVKFPYATVVSLPRTMRIVEKTEQTANVI